MRVRIGWLALWSVAVASFSGCDDDAVITPIPRMEAGVDLDFGPPPDRFIPPDMSPRGQLGDLCMDGSDCASGYCVERPGGGRVCTERCGDGSCPDGWECQLVDNGGADATFFCLADQPDVCRPCELDVECDDNEDLCIQIGARTYCGESCEGDDDCPDDYECASIERDEQTVMQCVPTSGECQPCVDMDGDGYGEGDGCLGFDCADDDPTTHEGAPELCDGVDNNCIDGIDEREAIAEEPPEGLICSEQGVCAGSFVICNAGEWVCNYPDTYEAGAETLCDGLDNDCDGTPDDDLDLTSDPANCRFCGNACDFENAVGLCAESNCQLGDCNEGFYNVDGNDGNGCEYACNLTLEGVEACDQVDNDCDGGTDEDFDQQTDVNHCGQCNRVCAFQNATPSCVAGECGIDACDAGWTDLNGMLADGCEFECGPTNGGVEICDTIDNDCDGTPDEGFDFANSLEHCGQCNRACAYPNAMAACVEGDCALSDCAPGFVNANGDLADGCEYACVPTRDGVEACDQIDNDCDGEVDEDFRNLPEICDQGDNDCDGNIDEGFDLQVDRDNCGVCGNACDLPDAIGRCAAGQCAVAECQGGFIDLDGLAENGCEYACQLTNGGLEACDDIDNDCDGNFDEDAPVDADPENCGACGRRCEFANADGACVDSDCVLDACEDGFVDLDGNPDNGCEYACQFMGDEDVPDVGNIDANCDGVDGDIARAIFVRTDGDDEQDGLTVETAVATLAEAIEIAAGNAERDQILIEAGVYRVDTPVALQGGMGLYAGYSNDFRVRGGNRALIESTAGRGVTAIGLDAPTVLERVDIQVTNRSDASESAVALFVDNSADHLTVREGNIRAGRGGAGEIGNSGGNGAAGTRGANGSGSSGGAGGSLGGGRGGNGRDRNAGLPGGAGATNGSPCGGAGGNGSNENTGCDGQRPGDGDNGRNGCNGGRGSQGLGGNGIGRFVNGLFRVSDGRLGGRGVHGGGAGGGGAGGGEREAVPFICSRGTGRGGGGGGGGGRGGNGGLGGAGGGASVGALISDSNVVLEDVAITTLGGGSGGPGGNGGSGGGGGPGGNGSPSTETGGGGGNGGTGGRGGNGGCGGGGGGGPSIGVWGIGNAVLIQRGEVAFDVAAGGAGGAVCAAGGGNAGAAGVQQDTRDVNLQ